MSKNRARETCFNLLLSSWEQMLTHIKTDNANTDDHEYDLHKTLFDKSLHYIEGFDLRHLKHGVYRRGEESDE